MKIILYTIFANREDKKMLNIYQDIIYKYGERYITGEYAKFKNVDISAFEKIEFYNLRGIKKVKCLYSQLFAEDDNLILCNNIAEDIEELSLQNGQDYDSENGCYEDIYQYYIIDDNLAHRLIDDTNEIIYYHHKLDVYILGVTHCGTAWNCVSSEYTF